MRGFTFVQRWVAWLGGVAGLAAAELRHDLLHTLLAILAVTLAVLAVTVLASTGLGVMDAGEHRLDEADRDLWITDDGVTLSGAGVENGIVDAHQVAAEIEDHEDVNGASPLAFQGTYITTDDGNTEFVTGVGLPNAHSGLDLEEGEAFSEGNVHYANGSYDGPRTDEAIIDRPTAETLGIEPGDTVTVATSPDGDGRKVTVVGISSTYSEFLGAPTLTMPLSELQALAGMTGTDRAALVTVTVTDDTDIESVRDDLDRQYPYEVRTNREQLEQLLESQAVIIASAATLVALAVLVGAAVVLNVIVLAALRRADELAALYAVGVSRKTLCGIVVVRSGVLAVLGGVLGLAGTPILAHALETVAVYFVGYSGLVTVTPRVYWLGATVAIAIGVLGALVAAWYVTKVVRSHPDALTN